MSLKYEPASVPQVRIYLEDKDFYVEGAAAASNPLLALRQKLLGESGPLREVNFSRHKWPGGLVN